MLNKICFGILFTIFSLSLKAQNNICENTNWLEITPEETKLVSETYKNFDTYPSCNENSYFNNVAVSYYKFVVPPTGQFRFHGYSNEHVGPHFDLYSILKYGLRILDSCNGEELFCDSNFTNQHYYTPISDTFIDVFNMPVRDTLILELFQSDSDIYVTELGTSPNNNCQNPVWIDLKPNYEHTIVKVDHSANTADLIPECSNANGLFADSYFQLIVPTSGRIEFQHNYDFGINIYDSCNGEHLFCQYGSPFIDRTLIFSGLNPKDTVIIQVFQKTPKYVNLSDHPHYLDLRPEPMVFNLKIREIPQPPPQIPIPSNNICSNAELIGMTEIVFSPEIYELETKPYCDTDPYYASFRSDAFYKFIVPSSGAVKFGRKPVSYYYQSPIDINEVYFGDNICGFSIYETCINEPLFCFPDEDYNFNNDSRNRDVDYGTVVIDQLEPNDTLILHLFAPGFDQEYTINLSEAEPLSSNTCEETIKIDINNNTGSSELISVSLSQNTLDKIPSCHNDPDFGQFHPYSDVFYQLTVPENGGFKFELSSEIGIAVYDACNGNELFCNYPNSVEQGIDNLTPNSNVIVQFYDYFDWQEGFSFSINADTNNEGCNQSDWTALKALYESTNGDNWINNTGWEQVKEESIPVDCDLSLLYGVNLNTNGRVYCLDLDGNNDCTYVAGSKGNNLKGTLTYEMHLLSELTDLCLNNNEISGNITGWLSKNLEQLLLHNNKLTGEISYAFFENLNKLEKVYLSSNNLSGRIPHTIKHCRNLTHLGLYDNQFEDDIPDLSELKKLQVLNLRNNQFTGSIPSELSEIPTLKGLYLSNNQLSGYFDEDLAVLCSQLDYPNDSIYIDTGNGFEAKWDDFCNCGAGSGNPLYLFYDSPLEKVYQHNADIVAFDFIIGLNNQQIVTFSASGITLEEGFEVKKGSSFLAEYNPCGE